MTIPKDPDMLYISRNSNDAWRVRWKNDKDSVHRTFNDFAYGGKEIALAAAKKFRNALIKVLS